MASKKRESTVESEHWGFPWDWEFNQPARIADAKRRFGITPYPRPEEWWQIVEKLTGKNLRPDRDHE